MRIKLKAIIGIRGALRRFYAEALLQACYAVIEHVLYKNEQICKSLLQHPNTFTLNLIINNTQFLTSLLATVQGC